MRARTPSLEEPYFITAAHTREDLEGFAVALAESMPGYVWLALAGAVWSLWGLQGVNGAAYEIVIHCITVGFAFSMILAHAPVIIPAIVHRALPYHRLMWLPYVLLHAGLVVRVVGTVWERLDPRAEQAARTLGAGVLTLLLLGLVACTGGEESDASSPTAFTTGSF